MSAPQTGASSDSASEGSPGAVRLAASKQNTKAKADDTLDPLPSAVLTEEILYRYLSAEIADQRGSWQAAYVNMLAIAQQTRDPRIAKRATEIALGAKQSNEAMTAIRLWRELAPYSDEATQYFLGFVVLSENLEEARPILQQRLQEARPQMRGPMILQMQRLLSRAKDKNAAFTLIEALVAPYKDLPESYLALSQAAFLKGDTERAAQEANSALGRSPGSEVAALTLAQVTPDKKDAAKSLAVFLTAYPDSREVRLAYARLLVEQKMYEQARAEFKTLLKNQPQDLTVLYAIGLLAAQSNELAEAEQYLTTYLSVLASSKEEERDPTQAIMLLAQIAEERKDIPAALKWLDQINPETPDAYFSARIKRAQLMAKNGNLAAARSQLKSIGSSGEEEQIQLLVAEAQILRDAKQPEEALSVMQAGIKRFPDNTDLLYDYAMLAEKLNKLDVMETALRKIIKLAPKNQHAYNALGYSFAERNIRLQESYELISKALELAPEDPFIMDSMGWVQFRLGRLKEAEALLRRAYELRPDAEIAVHLGEVLWVQGQREDAKKLWRDAIVKDPKNDTLKNTLARLQVNL